MSVIEERGSFVPFKIPDRRIACTISLGTSAIPNPDRIAKLVAVEREGFVLDESNERQLLSRSEVVADLARAVADNGSQRRAAAKGFRDDEILAHEKATRKVWQA